jgi:hypothetical protein
MKLKEQIILSKENKKLHRSTFVEDFYEHKKTVKDKRFGQISIWTKLKGDDILIMKSIKSKTKKKCKFDLTQASERLKLNHNYLMRMVDYAVQQNNPIEYEVRSFYQAPLQDLKKEIQRRRKLGK